VDVFLLLRQQTKRGCFELNKMIKVILGLALSIGLAFSIGSHTYAQQPKADFLDVSHYDAQEGLPLSFFQTAKTGGVKGVVVKVSEGTYYVDPPASVSIANTHRYK
jgi:hypothetical protein